MSKARVLAYFCLLVPAVAMPFGSSEGTEPGRPARTPDYRLLLDSRRFLPEEGVDRILESELETDASRHVIVQLRRLPNGEEIETLRERGVSLLDYLPHHAYFAAATPEGLRFLAAAEAVRAVLPVLPEDKASSRLRNRGADEHARNEDGTVRLTVVFFGDVDPEEALAIARRYGTITEARPDERTFGVNIREERIDGLLREDRVQWVEQAPPPKRELLDDLRAAVHADSVQAPPYGLNGTGAVFGQWESGTPEATHEDLQGRITIVDPLSTSDHATAVAGIMIGDGSRSAACGGTPYQWRGISTAAEIVSYDWPTSPLDLRLSTTDAIGTYGIMASSNSWGWSVCGSLCSYYGVYDEYTKVYDRIVRGSQGAPINVVFGAGNEGDCIACEDSLPHFPYGTISGPGATAKNSIAVGAVHVPDLTMVDLSGRGPVQDGRLKPDIVAPGCKGAVGIYVPYPPNDYADGGCGTSFSTPAVTGALGILRQQFDQLGYTDVAPHTYKALLLASAEDLGNPGPDYRFGHGLLDIQEAVDRVIANHPGNHLIRVDSVANGETDSYSMTIGAGAGPIRITLVWDDFRGTPGVAKQLVNDLDLWAEAPGAAWHQPYVLDPDSPSSPATTGVNDVDNVEVIEVAAPEEGIWTVQVNGALVPEGPQEYTLVLPTEAVCTGVEQRGERIPTLLPPEIIPNPFNPQTAIRYEVPGSEPVHLGVFNVQGRLVRVLVNERQPAGRHEILWDGRDDSGRELPSGLYFARLRVGRVTQSVKLTLIR